MFPYRLAPVHHRFLLAFLLAVGSAGALASLFAQDGPRAIVFAPIVASEQFTQENILLVNHEAERVVEQSTYFTPAKAGADPTKSSYVCTINLSFAADKYLISVIVTRMNGENVSKDGSFKSFPELLFASADIVNDALNLAYLQDSKGTEVSVAPDDIDLSKIQKRRFTLATITGMWQGDQTIDHILIAENGRAVAYLPGGVMYLQLEVKDSADGTKLIATQLSPNRPAFYRDANLSFEEAQFMAKNARMWVWELWLSQDGTMLVGIKKSSSFVRNPGGGIVVNNNYERPVRWTRQK